MLRNIHVLVIEDNQDAAWSVKKLLEAESTGETTWTVETAQDLTTATVSLQSGRVDVVLLDLHLPNAPAGAELVKVIKAVAPEIKCIAITGWVDDGQLKQEVLDAGASDFMTKPPNPTVLARKLMHAVIYRRADEKQGRIDALLDRLGQAMDAAVKSAGDSGSHRFPSISPKE
jgi:DNA-binding NtrC family response regulator